MNWRKYRCKDETQYNALERNTSIVITGDSASSDAIVLTTKYFNSVLFTVDQLQAVDLDLQDSLQS